MSDIVQFVQGQTELFQQSLSDQSISWASECQFAIQAFQKNDYLEKMARSNPSSAQNAIINVAAIGITLNPAAKLAYLVPRDGGVCLDISYMGLLHLAMSTGSIMWGQCKLVHENDGYESVGLDQAPRHKYNAFGDRGAIVGGYCTVKTADGDYLTEEMSLQDIKKVQDKSKAGKSPKGPWINHWSEMARKTIVKRASKYWPKVERLDRAIHNLNTDVGEGLQDEPAAEVIINPTDSIAAAVERQGRTVEQFFSWASQMIKREIQSFDDLSEDELQAFAKKLGDAQ